MSPELFERSNETRQVSWASTLICYFIAQSAIFFKVRLKNRNYLRFSLQIRSPIATEVDISIDLGITDITSKLIDNRERFD